MSQQMRERAAQVRRDALAHLTALAGDAGMCAIGRSGRSFPAAKYHEGRQAAAGQLARMLARSADEQEALRAVAGEWRGLRTSSGARGPDWAAYAAGGLDALEEITADADPADPGAPS